MDQAILLQILQKHLGDRRILNLLAEIIHSFHSTVPGIGLPLGNLTSQLLVNIYLNEFDQFVKQGLKVKHYLRHTDDFVVLSRDKSYLQNLIPLISRFLTTNLHLTLHPRKVSIQTLASGVDFLGWVHFPDHRVLRRATRRRMFRNFKAKAGESATLQSYLGLLKHGNTHKLSQQVKDARIKA